MIQTGDYFLDQLTVSQKPPRRWSLVVIPQSKSRVCGRIVLCAVIYIAGVFMILDFVPGFVLISKLGGVFNEEVM